MLGFIKLLQPADQTADQSELPPERSALAAAICERDRVLGKQSAAAERSSKASATHIAAQMALDAATAGYAEAVASAARADNPDERMGDVGSARRARDTGADKLAVASAVLEYATAELEAMEAELASADEAVSAAARNVLKTIVPALLARTETACRTYKLGVLLLEWLADRHGCYPVDTRVLRLARSPAVTWPSPSKRPYDVIHAAAEALKRDPAVELGDILDRTLAACD